MRDSRFTREAFDKMDLQAIGMEFAIEMVVKASNKRMKITRFPPRSIRTVDHGRRI